MKILFMGTPEISKRCLEKLSNVACIYTKPDKINGRSKSISYSPVKRYALENGIELRQPEKIDSKVIEDITNQAPDLIVVVAYGKILPKKLIEIPKYGTINVHFSLLPKYRGAAPIHSVILNNENKSGVTVMYINERMDAGDIILQKETKLSERETYGSLAEKLTEIGIEALLESIDKIFKGRVKREVQNEKDATYTKMISKEDMLLDFSRSAKYLDRIVRAYNPVAPTYFFWKSKRVKVFSVEIKEDRGKIGDIDITREGPIVFCSEGALIIKELQIEGKKRISGKDIINSNFFK